MGSAMFGAHERGSMSLRVPAPVHLKRGLLVLHGEGCTSYCRAVNGTFYIRGVSQDACAGGRGAVRPDTFARREIRGGCSQDLDFPSPPTRVLRPLRPTCTRPPSNLATPRGAP